MMKYQKFFSITIEHSYFTGETADLVLTPVVETEELLKRRGLLLKKTTTGIRCLVGIDKENTDFSEKIQNDVFAFYIFPTSDTVREFTDMSTVEEGKMMLFTNEKLHKKQVGLVASAIDQEGTCQGFPALAKVEIKGSEMQLEEDSMSFTYQIQFAAKAIQWKYYFISNTDDPNITLESRDEQISFNEMIISENTTDQIVTSLRLNFPNTQIKAFESKDLVPYSNKPIKNIKLIKNGDVLMSHLPNPKEEQNGIQIIKIK